MNVNLIVIGKLKEEYLRSACAEYIKRLGRYCTFELHELDECRLSDDPSEKEIAAALKKDPAIVSQPLLTTIIDGTSLLIYFGVAELLVLQFLGAA